MAAAVTVMVAVAYAARQQPSQQVDQTFRRLDRNGDGKLTADELPAAGGLRTAIAAADRDGDGAVTLAEARAAFGSMQRRPPTRSVVSRRAPKGGLFERIEIAGFTDMVAGTNGFAMADMNRDGRLDLILAQSPVLRGAENARAATSLKADALRVLVAVGPWRYEERTIAIEGAQPQGARAASRAPQIPFLADFNRDGYLDIFLTRHVASMGGRPRPGAGIQGCSLYISQGSWDRFADLAGRMGVRNETAYNRQASVGDVNGDGWLDIAIGCDNIGNAGGGLPHSRLYVFQPNGDRFEDGRFEDIGGTDLVPDFGGFYHDSKRDKAGPDITLRDVDGDGDLDLLQNYHVDVRTPQLPYSPGEYRQGVFCWKNMLRETGQLRFEKITGNGYAAEGKLRWNKDAKRYEVEFGKAPGLPYVTTADVDNDGDQDVLAVGPSDPSWSPRTEYVGGRFWRNLGGFRFEEATEAAGLGSLNWTYRKWLPFFGEKPSPGLEAYRVDGVYEQTSGLPRIHPLDERPYYADSIFGDFNNDGWQDLVVLDRREGNRGVAAHAVLYRNKGDGTFEPKDMAFSGLDFTGISGEAADMDGDGLLDLVIAADPDNTGGSADPDRYRSKVFRNMGVHGARANHWLSVRFSGVTDAALIGARVEVTAGGTKQYRWIHADQSYKSGSALEAHFGLGKHDRADVRVTLLSGAVMSVEGVKADRVLELDLSTAQTGKVKL
jgi:hypothetical protein